MAKQSQSIIEKTTNHGGRASGEEGGFRKIPREETLFEGESYNATIPAAIEEGFDSPEWVFQVIEGGIPVLLICDSGELVVRSRRERNLARFFPELQELARQVPQGTVIDADIVCRSGVAVPHDRLFMDDEQINASATARPCIAVAHDLLAVNGHDYTTRTTGVRRRALGVLLRTIPSSVITRADVVDQNGVELTIVACERGFAAVRGKMKASPYPGRESRIWVEIPCDGRRRMVVGGYRHQEENLILLCGVYDNVDNSELEFVESVTVPSKLRSRIEQRLVPLTRGARPFREPPPWEPTTRWTAPELVVEVNEDGLERLRLDLCPTQVRPSHAGVWRSGRRGSHPQKNSIRLQRRLSFSA